jgi:hypothetical protein
MIILWKGFFRLAMINAVVLNLFLACVKNDIFGTFMKSLEKDRHFHLKHLQD